jgi:outer membrane biosynthesis protein TonB
MARAQKLKVYRTPVGFHDAYVAAPSQKAALAAWGIDRNLFALGMAEVVTDPVLSEEPLSKPGTVIKLLRGNAAEEIAALPPDPPPRPGGSQARPEDRPTAPEPRRDTRKAKPTPKPTRKPKPKPEPEPEPRPSRSVLEEAEETLSRAKARQGAESKELAEQEAELARRRRALTKAHAAELARLERARDRADDAYAAAIEAWRANAARR